MASILSLTLLPFLSSLFLPTIVKAQESRAPHGLDFENPLTLSPSAFEFFHPKPTPSPHTADTPCAEPVCHAHLTALSASSKARTDATVRSTPATMSSGGRVSAGSVAGAVAAVAFVVVVAVGVSYYVVVKRRANDCRKSCRLVQPA